MKNIYNYEVGKNYPELRTGRDEVLFDIDDTSAVLIIKWNKPSARELKAVVSGNKFEIRSITLNGVSYILVKMGDLNWIDAPYNPHLSLGLTQLPNLMDDKNTGLALSVFIIDSSTGEIIKIRLIGLGNIFSKHLIKDIEELNQLPFDLNLYNKSISTTYSKYMTPALVKMSSNYYKLSI